MGATVLMFYCCSVHVGMGSILKSEFWHKLYQKRIHQAEFLHVLHHFSCNLCKKVLLDLPQVDEHLSIHFYRKCFRGVLTYWEIRWGHHCI